MGSVWGMSNMEFLFGFIAGFGLLYGYLWICNALDDRD